MRIYVYDKSGNKESDFDGMSLEDFLIWSLDGARQAYECNLPENEPEWEELDDDDKISLLAKEIASSTPEIEFFVDKTSHKSFTIWTDGKYISVQKSPDAESEMNLKCKTGFKKEKVGCCTTAKKDNTAYMWISEANLFANETEYVVFSVVKDTDTKLSSRCFYTLEEAREYMISEYQMFAEDDDEQLLHKTYAKCSDRFWKIYCKNDIE